MSTPSTSAPVRFCVSTYAALARLMPRSYRDAFLAESLADLQDLLIDASRMRGRSVFGTMIRATVDLLVRLPGEWWATRSTLGITERNRLDGRTGMGERMMNGFRELKQAGRALAKRPGFTAVAVLTLALGIGANVAIFSIVNAILLRPLPYADSEQLVQFRHHAPGLDLQELNNSPGTIALYRNNASFYTGIAAYGRGSQNLAGTEEAARVDVLAMSPEIFDVLRVAPAVGRAFNPDDAREEGPSVALLSHDAWTSRFGSDPSVIGRVLQLGARSVEVVGIMPEDFTFPSPGISLYTPMYVDPEGPFGNFGTSIVARLAPGMTPEAAQAQSTEIITKIPEMFPDISATFMERAAFSVSVTSLRDRVVSDVESTLWIVLGTVAFVLLIAFSNVANLFLVRAEGRQKEMAVRAAMGAGRKSVAGSFLAESLLLGAGGGLLGLLLAWLSVPALLSITELPRSAEVSVDGISMALAAVLSIVAALAFGAIPMTRYLGTRFGAILRDGGRANTSGRERNRARNLLVVSQLALGLVLLVGSGLMLRSFAELRNVDIGIEPEGVLTLGLNRVPGEDDGTAIRFFQDAADRIAALPGVKEVGMSTNLPLASGGSNGGSFRIESMPREEDALPPVAMYRAVGPSYFSSLGIPLLKGRDVERADWEEGRGVVWVNEQFERDFLNGDAIGERVTWLGDESEEWAEIVGVVGDVREFGLNAEQLTANAYFPMRARGVGDLAIESTYLTVKMEEGQDPMAVAPAAQGIIRNLDRQIPISATRTMDEIVSEAMESTSITMMILAVTTAMALFLGAIGLAGVISYVVGQRTREIGVRVALGASSQDVSGMILKQSMLVTVAGVGVGLVGAFGLTRLMEALLYGVSATDPVTFAVAPVVLVSVSLLATWWPVRRATKVNPMVALRTE